MRRNWQIYKSQVKRPFLAPIAWKYLLAMPAVVTLLGLTGCLQLEIVDTQGSTSALSSAAPSSIVLAGHAETWPGLCQAFTVTLTDSLGNPVTSTQNTVISLASTADQYYSDVGCSSTVTSVSVATGLSHATVYFKSSAIGSTNLLASQVQLGSSEVSLSTVQPTAVLVLGQPDFTSSSSATTATSLINPDGIAQMGSRFYVADSNNSRVLAWNSVPATNDQSADFVLGQTDLNSNTTGTSATTMDHPWDVTSDGTHLIVTDGNNNRVLIWNSAPTTTAQPADLVLGQTDMNSKATGTTATTLNSPNASFSDGHHLLVADSNNNRVLIWNSFPTTNDQSADVVVEQNNMTTGTAGSGTFNYPCFVQVLDGKLVVTGGGGAGSILIWNSIPTTDGQAPDVVLGEPDLSTTTGGTTASLISYPAQVGMDSQGHFFAEDDGNNRILVWNQIPSTNGAAADAVIGQTNMTSGSTGTSASTFYGDWGMMIQGSLLWMNDALNNRVLLFDIP